MRSITEIQNMAEFHSSYKTNCLKSRFEIEDPIVLNKKRQKISKFFDKRIKPAKNELLSQIMQPKTQVDKIQKADQRIQSEYLAYRNETLDIPVESQFFKTCIPENRFSFNLARFQLF